MNKMMSTLQILADLEAFERPEHLFDFISIEDQGMESLEFMLEKERLRSRIPSEVIQEYYQLYDEILEDLLKHLQACKEAIAELERNPKPQIHALIEELYQINKEEKED